MTTVGDLDRCVDAVDEVLGATVAFGHTLSEAQGALPTDCPGWSVKDNLAHMVGFERVAGGDPDPEVELPGLDHLASDVSRYMEKHVEVRRGLSLAAVVDELAGFRPRRIAQLRSQVAEGDIDVAGPFGSRPLSVSLPLRVFDLWAHEQDIRRAVGAPPRIDGAAAAISVDRTLGAWRAVLPENVDVSGTLTIAVEGGDSVDIVIGHGGSSASIRADAGVLTRLSCGRGDPAAVLGAATVDGDGELVAAILPHLTITP